MSLSTLRVLALWTLCWALLSSPSHAGRGHEPSAAEVAAWSAATSHQARVALAEANGLTLVTCRLPRRMRRQEPSAFEHQWVTPQGLVGLVDDPSGTTALTTKSPHGTVRVAGQLSWQEATAGGSATCRRGPPQPLLLADRTHEENMAFILAKAMELEAGLLAPDAYDAALALDLPPNVRLELRRWQLEQDTERALHAMTLRALHTAAKGD